MNFVIPEGIRILQEKLQVTSNKLIPTFNASGCNNNNILNNSSSYLSNTTNADFVLFLGSFSDQFDGTLAYATYCYNGIFSKSSFLLFFENGDFLIFQFFLTFRSKYE